jgi:nitrate reductase NapE component
MREDWCTWRDALGILKSLPYTCLVGGVLMLTMRRGWVGRDGDTQQVAPAAPSSRRRLGTQAFGTLAVVLVILVNFVGVFGFGAAYTVAKEKQKVENVFRKLDPPDFSDKAKPAASKAPAAAPAPRGLKRGSLLRSGAFRAAMADVRRAAPAGGRLAALRVSADRIDAKVLAGGRLVTLRKAWNAKAKVVGTDRADATDRPLVAFAALDPAAPQRIAGAAKPAAVDYLVLMDVAGLRWNVFLADGGGLLTASPDGRGVK